MNYLSIVSIAAVWLTVLSAWAVILTGDWRIRSFRKYFMARIEFHSNEIGNLNNELADTREYMLKLKVVVDEMLSDKLVSPFTKQDIERFAKAPERPENPLLSKEIQSITTLSARARNCLYRDHIYTVRALIRQTRDELLDIRSMGSITLREIEDWLSHVGLSLKEAKSNG